MCYPWIKHSLNFPILMSQFFNSSSIITSSYYSSTCPLYMGNLFMSPTWQISLVVPSESVKIPWVIFVLCSLSNDIYLCLVIMIPIIFIPENFLCLPSLIQSFSYSCDILKHSFPSSSHYGFWSTSLQDEDLEFRRWYHMIHYLYLYSHGV